MRGNGRETEPGDSKADPEIDDLGWANGWANEVPAIVERCLDERLAGKVHDCRETPGPWTCTHVFECKTCGYRYIYDSGD